MDQWHTIRCLHQQGLSRRRIAEQLGISRNTVARALKGDELPRYRRVAPSDLAGQHDEFIRGCLSRGLRGSRILSELRSGQGYTGSQAGFYRALERLRDGMASPSAALRFETGTGEQAQFDWSEYVVSIGGAMTKVFVFSMLYGYSRRCHWFPSLSVKQPAIFEALEASWRHFGGACRELVVDNPKTLVVKHTRTELVWHPLFIQLCGHYRVQPIAGTPRHPRGKGKVENPFGLLEMHFIQGSRWKSFEHFQEMLAEHEGRWEQRCHGTTGISPTVRFTEEQHALIPLPKQAIFGVRDLQRQVSGDCLVSYESVRYSVPAQYAGKTVWIRPSQGRSITIVAPSSQVLTTHLIPASGTRLVVRQEHFEALRRWHRASIPTLTARFREKYGSLGDAAESFLQRFIGQTQFHPERQLSRLLQMLEGIPTPVVLQVLADGLEYNLLSCNFLEARLQERMREAEGQPTPSVQLPLPELDVERPLDSYARALPSPSST